MLKENLIWKILQRVAMLKEWQKEDCPK